MQSSSSLYSYSSSGALFTPFPLGARGYFSPSFFLLELEKRSEEKKRRSCLCSVWGGVGRSERERCWAMITISLFSLPPVCLAMGVVPPTMAAWVE